MERDRAFPPKVVRFSELKTMSRSPAHFRCAYEYPIESTPAMRFGTLVHHLILGGTKFAVFSGERRAGKAWDAFEGEHADELIVTQAELDRAIDIARKVQRHPFAGPLLDGKNEHEMRWRAMGRDCAGRLDVLGRHQITDVKISTSAEPGWFARHAVRMAYHAQLAWYRDGARENGVDVASANIIAVEARRPYAVTVFSLTDKALLDGQKLCRLWMERLEICQGAQEGGYWPEYVEHVVPLDTLDDLDLTYGDEPSAEAA